MGHHAHPRVAVASRFLAGVAGTLVLGYVVFPRTLFRPGDPAFQCITVGAVAALITALVRGRMRGWGILVVLAYTALQWGLRSPAGWIPGAIHSASAFFLTAGIFLAAVVFDGLGQTGLRIGKFLILGPMVAGAYFAVTPLANLGMHNPQEIIRALAFNLLLGIVIGNGVGFGVELVDLLPPFRSRRVEARVPQQTIPD